jgi:S-adenosylmethionine:diacylglycerol 3-amino-3-carboxypropyl transferase
VQQKHRDFFDSIKTSLQQKKSIVAKLSSTKYNYTMTPYEYSEENISRQGASYAQQA